MSTLIQDPRRQATHISSFINSFFPPSVPANLKLCKSPFSPSGVNRPGNPQSTTFFPSFTTPPLGPFPVTSPRSAASIRPWTPLVRCETVGGGGDETDVMGIEEIL